MSDSNEKMKTGAALALWNIGADGDLVRQRVREMIVRDNNQPPLNNYVALFRSSLSDDEVTRGLEKQLTGVGAGDFTGGWLVPGPDAVDVMSNPKTIIRARLTCVFLTRRKLAPRIMRRRF